MTDARPGSAVASGGPSPQERRYERLMFAFLAIILWPVLTMLIIFGYGFVVWVVQMLTGPPGPPPV